MSEVTTPKFPPPAAQAPQQLGVVRRPHRPGVRVDLDRAQRAQVEHDAVVDRAVARDAVPAAPHREQHPVRRGGRDRRRDLGGVTRPDDGERAAVDHPVPDPPRVVVVVVARGDHLPRARPQVVDDGVGHGPWSRREADDGRGSSRFVRLSPGRTAREDGRVITLERLAVTADLPAPVAVVALDAFDDNAAELLRRAGGRPVRVATKSVRVPRLVERALAAGFQGLMAFSLREALGWAERGADDVVLGYPTVDVAAMTRLVADPQLRAAVTLMVDDVAHLDVVDEARRAAGEPEAGVGLCIDVDASLRIGRGLPPTWQAHVGALRSPLRDPGEVAALAREALRRGHEVRGLMFYEAQVAGLPDTSPAVRAVKRASLAELATRRDAVAAAVEDVLGAPLRFVNGGGTGSLERTAADRAVTELTAGSGLLAPTLFDGYRPGPESRPLRPAAFFGLDVVRRPAPGVITVFSGGFVASGPAGASRMPTPVLPPGLNLTRTEGAGEVQTPLRGRTADRLRIGDRVWFRHAKAGEVMERFAEVALLGSDGDPEVVPTYRGLGLAFG